MGFSQLHATRAHRNTKKSITYVHRQFHRPYRPHSIIFLIVILCLWFFFFYHSSRTHGALTDVNRFLCIRFLFNYTNTKINGAYYSRNIDIFRISVPSFNWKFIIFLPQIDCHILFSTIDDTIHIQQTGQILSGQRIRYGLLHLVPENSLHLYKTDSVFYHFHNMYTMYSIDSSTTDI